MATRTPSLVAVVLAALSISTAARAEVQVMSSERWQSAADSKGLRKVHAGALLGHLELDAGLFGNYERNPLLVRNPAFAANPLKLSAVDESSFIQRYAPVRRRLTALVANRVSTEVSFAVGLFNWVQLFGSIPVALYQDRGENVSSVLVTPESMNQFVIGDIRLGGKIRLLRAKEFFVDLALIPMLTLPVGLGFHAFEVLPGSPPRIKGDLGIGRLFSGYFSDGFPTFQPELALSKDFFGFFVGGNLGLRLRRPYAVHGVTVSQEVIGRLGVGFKAKGLIDRFPWVKYVPVELSLEASGATSINHPYVTIPYVTPASSKTRPELRIPQKFMMLNQQSGELFASAGVDVFWLHPFVGAAVGVLPGYGTPDFRVVGGVRLSTDFASLKKPPPPPPPAPLPPPPPADSDKDGIVDPEDACPQEPGVVEHRGCPPPPVDPCALPMAERPAVPEMLDCPDADKDGDGIINSADACVAEPETVNEFEDTDGCPDEKPRLDTDGDGIFDDEDLCPNDPEDKDGYVDDDGCPDNDNDRDGIADADDKCPMDQEIINGVDDDDGCPDEGKTLAKLDAATQRIEILEKVFFDTNKATIKPVSFGLLEQVARVLRANPTVRVRVEGHTDNRGKPKKNMTLSQARAESVRQFLVDKGVAPERLEAKGYGQDRPVDNNKTARGREANRRVEFVVISEESK